MPISENEAVDSECGWSARASDEMSPDQLDPPAAEKATLIVGRTRVTSAISMRPSRSGKYRSRAISSSATTGGSPDGSLARLTLWKRTLPDGNSDSEISSPKAGSSPVTARISYFTASRTEAAGNKDGMPTNTIITAAMTRAASIATRLTPMAAFTGRFSDCYETRGIYRATDSVQTCGLSVSLSWLVGRVGRAKYAEPRACGCISVPRSADGAAHAPGRPRRSVC